MHQKLDNKTMFDALLRAIECLTSERLLCDERQINVYSVLCEAVPKTTLMKSDKEMATDKKTLYNCTLLFKIFIPLRTEIIKARLYDSLLN